MSDDLPNEPGEADPFYELARLREEIERLGRENNRLKYGPEDFGGKLTEEVIARLREQLAEAGRQREAYHTRALEAESRRADYHDTAACG